MNWRLAKWWIAVNAFGAFVALAGMEINYQAHVQAHEYNPHPPSYPLMFLLWLAGLILLGVVDALACCWLDSLLRIHNRGLHAVITVAIAIVLACVLPFAGAALFGLEMFLAVWILLPTGILFGVLLAITTEEPRPAPAATR